MVGFFSWGFFGGVWGFFVFEFAGDLGFIYLLKFGGTHPLQSNPTSYPHQSLPKAKLSLKGTGRRNLKSPMLS